MKHKRHYGWKPQKPDFRDLKFVLPLPDVQIPASVDLRSQCPVPYDQGQLGSCTANAIAFLCEFDWMKEKKTSPYVPSRLFIYYNERLMEGTVHTDSGAQIRDGIKSLNKYGFCPEDSWPYDPAAFAHKPTSLAYSSAKKEIVKKYIAVKQDLEVMKSTLASGFPIVIGFSVYDSFESDEVASTGIVPMPSPKESMVGGHAVAIVGYDDKGWIVRNSWGDGWGMKGYFSIPYGYFTNPNLASDLWCVQFV